jgi:hypothetical protein
MESFIFSLKFLVDSFFFRTFAVDLKEGDMTYSLIINYAHSDPKYVNGILTWPQVTEYLRKKLDQWVVSVTIFKYSSDDRILGQKTVTMGNICEVAYSLRDKNILV